MDAKRSVFVGALHGMLTAEGLCKIFDDLFGGAIYAGIDTDKYKYVRESFESCYIPVAKRVFSPVHILVPESLVARIKQKTSHRFAPPLLTLDN